MATAHRLTLIRKAFSVSAVAIAATVLGASSTIASAAPVSGSSVSSPTSLDTPANWAIVKEAALNGYAVPANMWANCGITR